MVVVVVVVVGVSNVWVVSCASAASLLPCSEEEDGYLDHVDGDCDIEGYSGGYVGDNDDGDDNDDDDEYIHNIIQHQ